MSFRNSRQPSSNQFKPNLQFVLFTGRLLNMETQEMKFSSFDISQFDPDKTYWKERDDHGLLYVNVLRVFYELGSPANELLGIVISLLSIAFILRHSHYRFISQHVGQTQFKSPIICVEQHIGGIQTY